MSERQLSAITWAVLVVMFAFTALTGYILGFTFAWHSLFRLAVPLLATGAAYVFYTFFRPEPKFATTAVAMTELALFSAAGVQFTYVIAAMGGPLWDDRLFAIDMALGLDWREYLILANQHPEIAMVGKFAYDSIQLQTIITIIVLGFGGYFVRLRGFVAAVVLSGFITGIVSGVMPAVDAYVHLNPPTELYSNLRPSAGFIHLNDFYGLRDGSLRVLSLMQAEGIITFPSFHTTLGILFAWAFWPVLWLRWPVFILNAALIAATPIHGGHYFIDLIAGSLLAVLSIVAIGAIEGRRTTNSRVQVQVAN